MKGKKIALLITAAALTMSVFTGCGEKKKDYDLKIFNQKGEVSEQFSQMCREYEKEFGVKVQEFTAGAGSDVVETLRTLMNSNEKPGLYTIDGIKGLVEWNDGGFVQDLTQTKDEDLKKLVSEIPDNMILKPTEDSTQSFGIPTSIEGFGYIVDTRMLADLFGEDKKEAVLNDLVTADYDEFEQLVLAVDAYIKNDEAGEVTLSGNTYPIAETKTERTKKLTGVFAVAGSEKWTYGGHMLSIPLHTVFNSPQAAQAATVEDIDALEKPIEEYMRALDLKTSHAAGLEKAAVRGPEFINSTTNGYDVAAQVFAEGKALFMKQGNWALSKFTSIDPEMQTTLEFIPVKMPFTDADIKNSETSVEKMSQTISVFVPFYYAINAKVSEEEQAEAARFLVWMNTSETGQKYIRENLQYIPYNADEETGDLGNSLANSIIRYQVAGNVMQNDGVGCPTGWDSDTVGQKLMEEYMTKETWTEDDYKAVAEFGVSKWKEMSGKE